MPPLEVLGLYAWLVPGFTAAAFALILVVIATGGSGRLAARIAVAGILASTVAALALLAAAIGIGGEHLAAEPVVHDLPWLPFGSGFLRVGVLLDPLSLAAAAMVTVVCSAIFVFATSYMEGEFVAYRDPGSGEVDRAVGNARYARFFAFVSLFATGMLGFVLSSNLLEALVFWEIMGLCSFLLIGFWYFKPSASAAAVKAFLTTRFGDMFLLVGIMLLLGAVGSLDYTAMLSREGLASVGALGAVPLLGIPAATIVALLVFGGAVGKSAQFPLHVWLPDAMEGPTPVSALIHAATMVSAGVFLIARMFPLFSAATVESPGEISGPMFVVAVVGAVTAIFAATIGLAQFDVKRVLAFSTVSQLGYMVMALGIGAYVAAVFHLITHAFFKALLFLGSGSVIHGVEHGMHHASPPGVGHEADAPVPESEPRAGSAGRARRLVGARAPALDPHDAQDMRNMGNLRERMPFTFLTFLAGALALTGVPVFAGFWSKDEILADAFHKGIESGIAVAAVVWLLGTAAAFLTAFYMARQIFMVFFGPPRTDGARHAVESDVRMVGPLVLLAVFAVVLGFVGVPEALPGIGPLLGNPFHGWVGALTGTGAHLPATPFNPLPMIASVAAALAGWGLGWLVYGRDPAAARERDPLQSLGGLWTLLSRKYYVDEIYRATAVRLTVAASLAGGLFDRLVVDGIVNAVGRLWAAIGALTGWIDSHLVDGAVNLTGFVSGELSSGLRTIQSGRVQQYLLVLFLGVLALLAAAVL